MFQHYALSSYALTCALLRFGEPHVPEGPAGAEGRKGAPRRAHLDLLQGNSTNNHIHNQQQITQ